MTKPNRKKAVALQYDRSKDSAPRVTAKGEGILAQKIIDLALEHDIPIKDDPDLIEVLSTLEINQEIPSEVYVAVAELLAFVYAMNADRT
jgi:flagellar biosynthesis protein